jgi:hypothetical protein
MYSFDPFDTTETNRDTTSLMTDPEAVPQGDLDDVGTGYDDTVVDRGGETPGQPVGRLDSPADTPGVGGLDEMAAGSSGYRLDDMSDTEYDAGTYEL